MLAMTLGALLSSTASWAFDTRTGRQLAQRWCSECHAVEPGVASDRAPPFEVIARDPMRTPERLRAWLSTPHTTMPDFSLSRTEIEAIIAYLQSLASE